MPFTPFHLGPALLLGMIFKKNIDLTAVLIASVIIDIRAAFCLFFDYEPLHGPLHTYLGATILALLLSYVLNRYSLRYNRNGRTKPIVFGSLVGVWSHIFLDSFLYTDIVPFWPISSNPMYWVMNSYSIYGVCVLFGIFGAIIGIVRYLNDNQKVFI